MVFTVQVEGVEFPCLSTHPEFNPTTSSDCSAKLEQKRLVAWKCQDINFSEPSFVFFKAFNFKVSDNQL